jgi:predicted nucleic acid-binding protein
VTLAFWDSSALLKLLVEEQGTDVAVALWDGATAVVACRLAVPEVSAALAAAERSGRIDPERRRVAAREWQRYLAALDILEVTPAVGDHATDLAVAHPLSGADAVHLAAALALPDRALVVATWDRRLASAASAEGLDVVASLE